MQTLGDVITWGLIIAALIIVPYKIARAWLWPVVKSFFSSAPVVMSRPAIPDHPVAPLSIQTDEKQIPDRPTISEPSRNEMLDIFRLMRRYGIPREEARPILKAAGLKLDNNLWTAAAPPEDEYTTPIAGRSTKAVFDADYPYEPVP